MVLFTRDVRIGMRLSCASCMCSAVIPYASGALFFFRWLMALSTSSCVTCITGSFISVHTWCMIRSLFEVMFQTRKSARNRNFHAALCYFNGIYGRIHNCR